MSFQMFVSAQENTLPGPCFLLLRKAVLLTPRPAACAPAGGGGVYGVGMGATDSLTCSGAACLSCPLSWVPRKRRERTLLYPQENKPQNPQRAEVADPTSQEGGAQPPTRARTCPFAAGES